MASNVAIALALLWQLRRIKSPFKATRGYFILLLTIGPDLTLDTHVLSSLIHKLMASTISTGTLTSVFSVVGVILFVCNNSSNGECIRQYLKLFNDDWSLVIATVTAAATAFSFCEGRVFALTMLYNLNNRRSLNCGSVNTSDARCADSSNTINVMKEICEYLPTILAEAWLSYISGVHCTTDIHQESSVRSHIVQPIFPSQRWHIEQPWPTETLKLLEGSVGRTFHKGEGLDWDREPSNYNSKHLEYLHSCNYISVHITVNV